MGTEEKGPREGIERWMDERIRAALANLTHPFEAQIRQLQKRVETLKDRLQKLTKRTEAVKRKKPEDG